MRAEDAEDRALALRFVDRPAAFEDARAGERFVGDFELTLRFAEVDPFALFRDVAPAFEALREVALRFALLFFEALFFEEAFRLAVEPPFFAEDVLRPAPVERADDALPRLEDLLEVRFAELPLFADADAARFVPFFDAPPVEDDRADELFFEDAVDRADERFFAPAFEPAGRLDAVFREVDDPRPDEPPPTFTLFRSTNFEKRLPLVS